MIGASKMRQIGDNIEVMIKKGPRILWWNKNEVSAYTYIKTTSTSTTVNMRTMLY